MTSLAFLGQKLMFFKRTQGINKLILRSCEIYKRTQDGYVPGDISKMMPSTKQLKLCIRGIHLDASQAIRQRSLYTRPRKGDIFFRVSPTSACGNCLTLVQGSTNVRKLIPSFASTPRRTVMLPSTCIIRKEQQKSNSELITNNKLFDFLLQHKWLSRSSAISLYHEHIDSTLFCNWVKVWVREIFPASRTNWATL